MSVYFYCSLFFALISSGKHFIQFSQWSGNRLMGPLGVRERKVSHPLCKHVQCAESARTVCDLIKLHTGCPSARPGHMVSWGWGQGERLRTHTRLGRRLGSRAQRGQKVGEGSEQIQQEGENGAGGCGEDRGGVEGDKLLLFP